MDALILSCGTGGGHNAAGYAIKEELIRRGHHVEMFDPYMLVGKNVSGAVNNTYINLVQKAPDIFGFIYKIGDCYRKLPFKSPVYYINQKPAMKLYEYLNEHHFDVIITPHLFPAEIITVLKNKKLKLPKTYFIATDYVCIPFTEETNCDYYIVPHKDSCSDFMYRGISRDKLLPFGIPVNAAFTEDITPDKAKIQLGLNVHKKYIMVAGGSMGAGNIDKITKIVFDYTKSDSDFEMIVICGNNDKLYNKLKNKYAQGAVIIKKTDKMHLYMKASEIFFTKPGGLSSTEAAAANTPIVHISPIPGCETHNKEFFRKHGLSLGVSSNENDIVFAINKLKDNRVRDKIISNQKRQINAFAGKQICDYIEKN